MTLIKTPFDAKKQIQAEAREAQSSKLRKLGAVGNLKRARHGISETRKYGGSGGSFARGGAVESGVIEGGSAHRRSDKGSRKGGKGAPHTSITIAMMPHQGAPAGMTPGMPPMAAAPAPAPHPPMAMAGPPPGGPPGGPPPGMGMKPPGMGMASSGGAIRYARGGKIQRKDGGKAIAKRLKKDAEAMEKHEEGEDYARGGKIRQMPFTKGEKKGAETMKPRRADEEHDEDVKLPGTGRGGKNEEDGSEKHFGRAEGGRVIHTGVSTKDVDKAMHKMTAGASSGVGLRQKNDKEITPIRGGNFNTNRKG